MIKEVHPQLRTLLDATPTLKNLIGRLDGHLKAYRKSVLYVNLVSVLKWVQQQELRGRASDDQITGRIAEPAWMWMDFSNDFKCRMGGEDVAKVHFNHTLWSFLK